MVQQVKTLFANTLNFAGSKWSLYGILVLLLLFIGYMKLDHVFERDEALILLIVNGNRNFFDLIYALRYEGSTGLYHVILWLLSWFIKITPFTVSIITYCVSAFFSWFLLFKIRVPLILKLLFLVQISFLIFNLENRQYIFIPLALALFIYYLEKSKLLAINIIILFIMQIHSTAIPIAGGVWLFYLGDSYLKKRKLFTLVNAIPVLGLLFAYAQLVPPDDIMTSIGNWQVDLSFRNIISSVDRVFTRMLNADKDVYGFWIISVVICLLAGKLLLKDWRRLLLWLISFGICFLGFLIIEVTKYLHYKHYQILLYTLLAFLYIGGVYILRLKFSKYWYIILIPLLVYYSYQLRVRVADFRYAPYSHSRALASYLDKNFPNRPILVKPETHFNAVKVYRKTKDPFFALGRNEFVEYTVWNHPSVDHKNNPYFLPVHFFDLRNDILSLPYTVLMEKPIVVLAGEVGILLYDSLGYPLIGEILISDRIKLSYRQRFLSPSLNHLTERFVVYELEVVN